MDTPNDNNPESNIPPPNQDDGVTIAGEDDIDIITRLRGKHAANFATLITVCYKLMDVPITEDTKIPQSIALPAPQITLAITPADAE